MNTIRTTTLLAALVLVAFAACKKEESMEEWGEKMAEKMCSKLDECKGEMMAGIPENMRAQMQAQMPTKASCMENARKARAERKATKQKEQTLTSEEITAFKGCMDSVASLSCKDMMSPKMMQDPACQKANEISQRKMAE